MIYHVNLSQNIRFHLTRIEIFCTPFQYPWVFEKWVNFLLILPAGADKLEAKIVEKLYITGNVYSRAFR